MTTQIPRRGDQVAVWLRAQRDAYPEGTISHGVIDDVLDAYRLHADTGTPLDEHVCESGNPDDYHGCHQAAQQQAPEPEPAAEQMSDERLAEISARHSAATRGPWWSDDSESCWRLHGVHAELPSPFPGFPPQILNHQILKAPKRNTPYAEYWPNEADAEFISHAWQDQRELLAEIDRLRSQDATAVLVGEINRLRADLAAARSYAQFTARTIGGVL